MADLNFPFTSGKPDLSAQRSSLVFDEQTRLKTPASSNYSDHTRAWTRMPRPRLVKTWVSLFSDFQSRRRVYHWPVTVFCNSPLNIASVTYFADWARGVRRFLCIRDCWGNACNLSLSTVGSSAPNAVGFVSFIASDHSHALASIQWLKLLCPCPSLELQWGQLHTWLVFSRCKWLLLCPVHPVSHTLLPGTSTEILVEQTSYPFKNSVSLP